MAKLAEAPALQEGELVLVVDDFDDARETFAEYLTYMGFRVESACNGIEALEKVQHERPDVILMDLSMPELDGWETTRRLREDERTKDIPVIAMTGHAMARHREAAERAGCDEFLAKPAMPDEVVDRIQQLLAKSRTRLR